MALYHLHVGHVSRGAGQSAVSASAYRSGESLHDDYYNETPDYTRKGGVVFTEIMLPSYVPERLQDRETLWNEVEKTEKHPKAQLAYSFDIALQNELTMDENIALARRFVQENFVDRGMIADLAVHNPDKGAGGIQNPHFHVLCPIRPVTKDGAWGAKQRREYLLDERGERITGKDGKYIFNAVPTTDWNSPETLKLWRKNWADLVNDAFREKGIGAEIDERSYEEIGISLKPTIHEGAAVCAMEEKGIHTERRLLNRTIRERNTTALKLMDKITEYSKLSAEFKKVLAEEKARQTVIHEEEKMLFDCLVSYFDKRNASAYSSKAKVNNLKQQIEAINFMRENDIHSIDDLLQKVTDMYGESGDAHRLVKANEDEAKEIREALNAFEKYSTYKPVYDQMCGIRRKSVSDKFKEEHRADLSKFYMARRILKEKYPGGTVPVKKLKARLAVLDSEHETLLSRHKKQKAKTDKMFSVYKAVYAEHRNLTKDKNRDLNRARKRTTDINR